MVAVSSSAKIRVSYHQEYIGFSFSYVFYHVMLRFIIYRFISQIPKVTSFHRYSIYYCIWYKNKLKKKTNLRCCHVCPILLQNWLKRFIDCQNSWLIVHQFTYWWKAMQCFSFKWWWTILLVFKAQFLSENKSSLALLNVTVV